MIVYIAGPMKGLEEHNRPAFIAAEIELNERGYKVLNPAILPEGMDEAKYMPICLQMVAAADVVATLPGWQNSDGAQLETIFAAYQGKRIVEVAWLIGKDEEVRP